MDGVPSAVEHGVLERRGVPVHYWVHGERSAPLIACTHGASLDHDAFAPNVPAMVATGHRVLTWDLPGHGASRPIGEPFDVRTLAGDLRALLDAVEATEATLVGQSLGGLVSQQLQIDHPERVSAMVMVGSTDLQVPLGRAQAVVQRLRPAILRLWPDGHLRRTFARMFAETPQARRYVARATRAQPKADLIEVTRAALAAVSPGRANTRVPVPVLLVHGERDLRMVVRAARRWEATEAGCRRVSLPGAGHLANLDRPEAFDAALTGFVRELRPAAALVAHTRHVLRPVRRSAAPVRIGCR
jgi:3-oxoadipate enol-lactonase